ncbi:PKD domain-containing protein [Paucibacter sp. APW11]|uniref:PKD domain-containing protein n=1 Tax=Roseateles aquae TaxID=3077235 RepID=A0ABU3PHA9_9BURK|nr:PKD domain-containing protein [Paucibacter sp. APW11]MDT9001805.1 PKD domain-containing protein [Paucibacter sp. APW11]
MALERSPSRLQARSLTALVLSLSAAMPLISAAQATNTHPKPLTVAQAVSADVRFKVDPRQALSNGERRIAQKVGQAGADFIKVHFAEFRLPAGAYVLVSSADGQEVHRYDAEAQNNRTYDRAQGEDGLTRFAALSVFGETAIVTLVLPAGVAWGPSNVLRVDQFHAGQMGIEERTPLSVCGTDERRDPVCFASSNPTQYDRTRPVARLLMAGSSLCTGWRVGADNRMFTNNHCFADQATLTNTEVWFNYQNTSCGGSTQGTVTKVTGGTLLKTDATLDYSLFTINNFANVASFGYLGLEVRDPTLNEAIYIAQHGGGRPKQLAITSDQDGGGNCKINNANAAGNAAGTDAAYYCDTEGGSSGSPVIAGISNKAIALHHFGGCTNQGVKISKIWPQVATHFNNQVPNGDSGGSTNQPPVANFTSSCNGLSCSFNAGGSSDADGSIVSYAWVYGDGKSGSGLQVSNSYAGAGSYTVNLTVTDDKGATASKSATVNVTSSGTGFPKTNLSAAKGSWLNYSYTVPAGVSSVSFNTTGSSGDADLYLKKGAAPTTSSYGCRSWSSSSNESCSLAVAAGDVVYIGVYGYTAFSGLTLNLK